MLTVREKNGYDGHTLLILLDDMFSTHASAAICMTRSTSPWLDSFLLSTYLENRGTHARIHVELPK